jgi:plasmid stabilization system protein ParE
MIRIRIPEEALEDLAEGFWFYEAQESGLGDYFSSHLQADIEGLNVTAGIHRQTYRDYFRLLSRVFPYAIYYTMDRDEVVIWAVIDCRRNPEWIMERLGN